MKSLRDTFTANNKQKTSSGTTKNVLSFASFDSLTSDYSKSNSKVRQPEYHLGGGIVLTTNQLVLPSSHLPFGVRFEAKKSTADLSHNLLISDLSELTIARLTNQGFSEPKYLKTTPVSSVFVMKSRVYPIVTGFHIHDGSLLFTDLAGITYFPTFQLVMLLIALQSHFPLLVRKIAMGHFATSSTSLGLRFEGQFDIDILYEEYRCIINYFNKGIELISLIEALELDHGASTSKTSKDKYTPQAGVLPVEIPETLFSCSPESEEILNGTDNFQTFLNIARHIGSFNNLLHTGLAVVFIYVLVRFIVDICLTMRFALGCLLGLFIPKPSLSFAYPPNSGSPSFRFVPQSGEAAMPDLAQPESSDLIGAKTNELAAIESAPTPLATNKDHTSCFAMSTTDTSLPTTGFLSNTSTGFAVRAKSSPAKPPASQQKTSTRKTLGFGV